MPTCNRCGNPEIDVCPQCGKPVEVYSRIVGYMTPLSRWNPGKAQEMEDRVEYETWDSAKIKMDTDVT
jgi:anaerobic ribonucleoside-triphosphate reductase